MGRRPRWGRWGRLQASDYLTALALAILTQHRWSPLALANRPVVLASEYLAALVDLGQLLRWRRLPLWVAWRIGHRQGGHRRKGIHLADLTNAHRVVLVNHVAYRTVLAELVDLAA